MPASPAQRNGRRPFRALVALGGAAVAVVAGPAPGPNSYTLFSPTPAGALRELTTDRPDVTESPFTVDAGHAQLEMDFANLTRDERAGARATTWEAAPFNLRLGLRPDLEAGIFISPYARETETAPGGPRSTHAGFGDVTLRTKVNFWGDDGGATAFGLIFDVTLPTAARGLGSDRVGGDFRLPVAFDLGGGWDGGAMTVVEFRPADSGGYRLVSTNTATFGHDLAKDVSGYLELTSAAGDGSHVATFDTGVAWKLNANTQLDAGAKFGLSRAADDLLVFAGLSRRF